MTDAISGWTEDDESEFRRGLLEATPQRLGEAAEIIRSALAAGGACVVGAGDILSSFKKPFDEITVI